MRNELRRFLCAAALIGASIAACTGGEATKDQMAAGIDSLSKQRDSTMARMDSTGVIRSDSTHADSVRRDSIRRDSINRATKRP